VTDPTLVIHGVGNRDPKRFAETVRRLALDAGRDPAHFVPVFWGHLGAALDGLVDTIPGATPSGVRGSPERPDRAGAEFALELLGGAASLEVRATGAAAARARVAGDAFERHARGSAGAVRGAPVGDLRESFELAWLQTEWLKGVANDDVLRELGEAVADAVSGGEDGAAAPGSPVRGLHAPDLHALVKRVVAGMDRAVGAVLGEVGGSVNSFLREALAPGVARFLGDVLVYQRHRQEIHALVRAALHTLDGPKDLGTPNRPVTVVAHSLGGVISFDMATCEHKPLSISHLVTFGSQSPFMHILDPRRPVVKAYTPGAPCELPDTIATWTNLWEPRDPLAFIAARLFVLSSGTPPTDIAVRSLASSGVWTHSSYWRLPELAGVIHVLGNE
jgi:hypothetical protein